MTGLRFSSRNEGRLSPSAGTATSNALTRPDGGAK
jgi:hypothetical protein